MANINVAGASGSTSFLAPSGSFNADIAKYIQEETLPLAIRQLVAFQFGDPIELPKGRGTTYYASRYERLNLPYAPLAEGVSSVGQSMPLTQISATAQQWGDAVYITDVAELTIMHPLFKKAIELTAIQLSETLERNSFSALLAGTVVNLANGKLNRTTLTAADRMTVHEVNRAVGLLLTRGAPRFMGDERPDMKLDAAELRGDQPFKVAPHYVAIIHPLVAMDMREDPTVLSAWSYSDVNKIYNSELGQLNAVRFTESNLVPSWTGAAQVTGTASAAGGTLPTQANTFISVVELNPVTGQEVVIHQPSGALAVTGPTGSIMVTIPAATTAGNVFNIYIDNTTGAGAVVGGALVAPKFTIGAGGGQPNTGPLAGNLVGLTPSQTVTITGTGAAVTGAFVAPAAPATGVTVYPTFFVGKSAYGQVILDTAEFNYLAQADKSDPQNQLRVVTWKMFYGTILLNTNFFMRVEASTTFTG